MYHKDLKNYNILKQMNTNQVYNLSNIKQLIDLNGDVINFDLTFSVVSKNGKPFDALVVTQEMLDSGKELEYQQADGSINGKITNDKNNYNNYFLILKSDEPNECEVSIELTELQPNVTNPIIKKSKSSKNTNTNWKLIMFYCFIALVVLLLLYILYTVFFVKSNEIGLLKDDINGLNSKINGLNDGLNSKIVDLNYGLNSKIVDLNDGLNSKIVDLNDGLNNLNKGLNTKINGINDGLHGLSDGISGLSGTITKTLDGLEGGLTNKISESLDGLNNGFNDKFNESLNGLNGLSNKINEKFDGLNSGLTNKFDYNFEQLNNKLSELDGIGDKLKTGLSEMKGELVETISLPAEIKPPPISTDDIYQKIQNLKLKS